ncbi:metal-dependent hydrolase [Longilinea arvoryzae]|uniref:Metal-dependent hydrolase n=1 Tax=Longilinea arvoryzae TaxID=360412 RepID=A0A0S7BF85_9CHLR|nr:endonuclease/exonuclease/phosphatase family protein [Longilinea arvoryzae]GAP12690.1 metal-dependent hydrolase [Longilinea arvoryzae]
MIRIMSFNIRCSNCADGLNRWENRKPLVLARIQAFQPDLLGVQECRDDGQAGFLKAALPEYQFYGVQRGGGGETGVEMAPIFVRKECFQVLRAGHFWLSETPQIPGSIGWDATFARTAAWAELLHRPTGRRLVFLNTHFDLQPAAIAGAAHLLRGWAKKITPDLPLIVTGDFNSEKDSPAYRELTAEDRLHDVYRQAHPGEADAITFHGYGNPEAFKTIDWILGSRHFTTLSTSVDPWQNHNRYPSDHYPLRAEVEWKQTGEGTKNEPG